MGCHPCSGTTLKEDRIWTLKSNSLSNRKEVFPIGEYCWVCCLCVWTSSDTVHCKASLFRSGLSDTVPMNGNLSQDFSGSRIGSSVNKVSLFPTIGLVWLCWVLMSQFYYCYCYCTVTTLLFYLAGSGASSPLTSPSSPTPPSTAGKFKSHYSVCLFLCFLFPLAPQLWVFIPKDG